jgi:hypothetical protein
LTTLLASSVWLTLSLWLFNVGKKMKCAKIVGMGLLVGAALTVVIPE